MSQIEYTWDKKLALQSAQDIYEYELKNSNKKYIGWLFIAMLQFGVVGALKHNAYGFLLLSTLGLSYWYGLRWPLRKYLIKNNFSKSLLANKTIKLEIKNDGLYHNNKLEIPYKSIKNFIVLEKAIVIYHTLGTIYLPNSAFESSTIKSNFLRILTN